MTSILASNPNGNGFQEAGILALIVLLAILQNLWAYKAGVFTFRNAKVHHPFPTFKIVAQLFLIYFAFSFILPPIAIGVLRNVLTVSGSDSSGTLAAMMIHGLCLTASIVAIGLFIAPFSDSFKTLIWKRDPKKSIFSDIFLGICGFLISYPVVLFAGNFFDWLVRSIFKLISYEQVAVKYLKNTQGNIFETLLALYAIVIFAPIVEELLFRGFLQTFLRRYLKPQPAFLITSFFFAVFHFSLSQGYGNISVILTLFILGWYLGVIYERQGSLLSVISFHAVFNLTSAWRVLLDPSGVT